MGSTWEYLRTVWLLLWTAFRHPRTTTVIDVRTGKYVNVRPGRRG